MSNNGLYLFNSSGTEVILHQDFRLPRKNELKHKLYTSGDRVCYFVLVTQKGHNQTLACRFPKQKYLKDLVRNLRENLPDLPFGIGTRVYGILSINDQLCHINLRDWHCESLKDSTRTRLGVLNWHKIPLIKCGLVE
jgi:hypothetical protein